MELKNLYRQARARGNTAHAALSIARRHIAGPLATYRADLAKWNAEPDKRRHAAGGCANRPKFPELYRANDPADLVPDGYRLFGFLRDDSPSRGLTDSPDYGYYADTWQDATYYPCVLIRRTSEPHVWACIPAYWDAMAWDYVFTDRDPRDLAYSHELFDQSEYGAGSPELHYSLCQDARDAARAALSLAESDAESAREHDEKWQEASRHDSERQEARDELKDSRRDASATIAAWREQQKTGPLADSVCAMLRKRIETARDDMRRAIERIEQETAAIESLDMAGEF